MRWAFCLCFCQSGLPCLPPVGCCYNLNGSAVTDLPLLLLECATMPPTSGLLLQLKWFCTDRSVSASARVGYHASQQYCCCYTLPGSVLTALSLHLPEWATMHPSSMVAVTPYLALRWPLCLSICQSGQPCLSALWLLLHLTWLCADQSASASARVWCYLALQLYLYTSC